MEKQKMWFLNYKNRKDSTMSLVYNLVTQQDAANNIQLGIDMKKNSTSMNAITVLTMVFLPGTFTAVSCSRIACHVYDSCIDNALLTPTLPKKTVLGAGIFSAIAGTRNVQVSGIWWLWTVITVPLTLLVIICWWWYKISKAKAGRVTINNSAARNEESLSTRRRKFSLGGLSLSTRQNGPMDRM